MNIIRKSNVLMNNASIFSGQFIVLFSLINNGHKKLQISLHEHSTNYYKQAHHLFDAVKGTKGKLLILIINKLMRLKSSCLKNMFMDYIS